MSGDKTVLLPVTQDQTPSVFKFDIGINLFPDSFDSYLEYFDTETVADKGSVHVSTEVDEKPDYFPTEAVLEKIPLPIPDIQEPIDTGLLSTNTPSEKELTDSFRYSEVIVTQAIITPENPGVFSDYWEQFFKSNGYPNGFPPEWHEEKLTTGASGASVVPALHGVQNNVFNQIPIGRAFYEPWGIRPDTNNFVTPPNSNNTLPPPSDSSVKAKGILQSFKELAVFLFKPIKPIIKPVLARIHAALPNRIKNSPLLSNLRTNQPN